MPYELFLAIRHLGSRHRRRLARVTALVAVIGIAVGVAALVVALGLANGFRDEMRDKILQGTAHLSVMRTDGQPMPDYKTLAERIRRVDAVSNVSGTTYDGAVLIGPKGSAYAVLRGVDDESEHARTEISRLLIEGASPVALERKQGEPPGVIIGVELAKRTGLVLGDATELIPANANLQSEIPVRRVVRVAGIFRSGLFEYDSTWIYLSLRSAAAFSGYSQAASVLSVQVRDIYSAKEVAGNLRTQLGNYFTVLDWQDANRPLFTALALERRMGLFIITLIIFIAALNITTTLVLVVVERRGEIAILGAMGATGRSIIGIFMLEGALIGAVGAALGAVLGSLACLIGNYYKLVSLPGDVYSISYVPFHSQTSTVFLAISVAFALSLIATIYPARAAARVRPVEMLRDLG